MLEWYLLQMFWLIPKGANNPSQEMLLQMQFLHVDLLRKVVYFEWILILICALGEWVALQYHQPDPSAPNLVISLLFLSIVFFLSFVLPVKSTYWDRLCFLFLEVVLLTGCAASGLWRFVFPIYMVTIAKAYLILDRPGLVIIFIAALVTQMANGCFKLYIANHWIQKDPWSIPALLCMAGGSLVMNYAALSMMVLVGMLTETLVAEQRARQETERLSNELQKLATELERTRIAREIHDSLGHTLTSMNIQLEVARKFATRDHERSLEALDLAKQLAGQSLTDVRMAVHSIRNPDFDLQKEIEELTRQLQRVQDVKVDVTIKVREISSAVSYQLYRITQECLTNIMKHAEATMVKVELKQSKNTIELNISDNGKGLPTETKDLGFGIRGMQERVESMHGTMQIESSPGNGTQLKVIIPL